MYGTKKNFCAPEAGGMNSLCALQSRFKMQSGAIFPGDVELHVVHGVENENLLIQPR